MDVALEDVLAEQIPEPAGSQRPVRRVAPHTLRQFRIPPVLWRVVAADARRLGLRQVGRQHGVSHEAVRQIMHRVMDGSSASCHA